MQLLADAEGSTKDIAITVPQRRQRRDALAAGRACARNNLLKTALFGNDPELGAGCSPRIGTTDAAFEPDRVDVTINGVTSAAAAPIGTPARAVDLPGRESRPSTSDSGPGGGAGRRSGPTPCPRYVHENSAYGRERHRSQDPHAADVRVDEPAHARRRSGSAPRGHAHHDPRATPARSPSSPGRCRAQGVPTATS
jgi:hypothetical protein